MSSFFDFLGLPPLALTFSFFVRNNSRHNRTNRRMKHKVQKTVCEKNILMFNYFSYDDIIFFLIIYLSLVPLSVLSKAINIPDSVRYNIML